MKIAAATARRLMVQAQGLHGGWQLPPGKEGAAQAVERLGQVQVDTIAVVQRAHHHILWSRCPDYSPEMLHALLTEERRLFEHWNRTTAACYLPMCDYRYYLPHMRHYAEREATRRWLADNAQLVSNVLARLRAEGPLSSADFEAPPGWKREQWWSWKPAKQALETLFSAGVLMVSARRSFQRLYDLAEPVLPPGTDAREPGPEEMAQHVIRRELGRLGLASGADLGRGVMKRWQAALAEALAELSAAGEVVPVTLEGVANGRLHALATAIEQAEQAHVGERQVHILSPFDGVLHRRRLEEVFGFDYSIECYVSAAKRRYGYFCLPILWGEEFVGRLDPKAARKRKTLILHLVAFEPGFADYDVLLPLLAAKLRLFAAFNDCEEITIERTEPAVTKEPLERALAGA